MGEGGWYIKRAMEEEGEERMTGGCIDIWDYLSAYFNWFGRSGDWWDEAVSFFSLESPWYK